VPVTGGLPVPRRQKPPMTILELGAHAAGLIAYCEWAKNRVPFDITALSPAHLSEDGLGLLKCMDPALFWKWFLIGWATALEKDTSK
jgi:hypothetical protein